MKRQSYKKGWAFVLTLVLVFTNLFGGFGFLGIKGAVGEVYAAEDVTWSNGTVLGDTTVTDGAIITIPSGATVTLDGTITISGSAIITGSGIIQAGAGVGEIVDVASGSSLTISGVTIDADNSPRNVVQTSYNTFFNMVGASKIINSAGVGVWVSYSSGTFNMGDNAKISNCHSGDGGGVYSNGTVVMSENAEISNCTANYRGGGGILADSGTFSMMDNAKISDCSSTSSTYNWHGGGGVWVGSAATFNMNGGIIENCQSATYGGGAYIYGATFNMSGGTIQNCAALSGGGISFVAGSMPNFNVSDSPKVVNNIISGTAISSNIQLNTGIYVQITGAGLTADASLGITPATSPTGSEKVFVATSSALLSAADAVFFHADSSDHFITYSSIVASNTLFLVANGWTPLLTPETTPTAAFEASTMTLSNISSGMKYSINGGTSYIDITSNGSITINGVTAASGIKVYKAGNGTTTTNSAIQTITITKAATPVTAAFTVTQPGTVGGKGTIAGITAAMEYSTNGEISWTNGGSTVSGLAGSTTVLVRIKGAGTVLASDNCTLTINAYIQTALVNNSFEIPALGETSDGWWTDYKPTTAGEKAAFGWKTTATGDDEKFEVGGNWNITGWGIGFIPDGRQFIELNASEQAAVYQDLSTTPGSVIYWSLYQGGVWYSSSPNINNKMAVRIGSPEQLSTSAIMIQTTDTGYDQEWKTRTIYNNATMTAINTTPTTYGAMELTKKILYTEPKRWTKYEGTYEVPAGQTETRFAFASLSAEPTQGNLLDGVVFRIANTTKAITAFNFNGLTPNVTGTINEGAHAIALTVPYGTDVTALVPTITHTGASVSPSAVVAQNFTGPVTYTVTPETGAAQEYVVTVTVAMPTKAITAFNFNGLTPNVTGTVNETAKTIALTVPYGTDVTALVPTITYSGVSITSNSGIAQNFTSPVTYTVTAADSTTQAYIVTVTVASNGGGGGGHSSTPTAPANATVTVNGQSQDAGITTTSKVGDKTLTTVTIDDKKIQEKIKEEGNQSTVSIPIGGNSDIGEGVLNGQTIKDMENKESVLEIKTNSTTYTLPASEINIDSVSSQFGQTVDLKDIKISVRIAEPSADTTKIVQDTANKNNYQVVVKPVDFEITCTSGSKTVTVSKFNGYVERMVAIPDGIDPSKVTTGIVLNNDGTFSHVPTTIVKIDGKYYAKINSLTNSTYSVIYNPIEFADVAKHWAKDSINEMGSRLVISGVGGNNYEPNRDITRAEFAAIMVRALGLVPDTAKNNFNDVADSKWYSGYVGTAASYGIISGYDTDTFAPNDKITREQAMTMVARAMAITDLEATTSDLNAGAPLTGYADTNKISAYAKAGILACLKTGVVTGKTADTIAPKNNITRAEVAVIIERLLKKSELI